MNSSKKSRRMCEELLLSLIMGTYTENDLKNILSIASNKMINMNYSMRQYFIKHIYSYCKSKTNYDKIFLKHKKLSIDEKILAFNTFQDPKDYFISFIEKNQFDFQADSFEVIKYSDVQKNDYKENEEYRLYQIKAFLSSFSQFTKLFPNKIMEEKTTVFRILCNLLYMNIFDHQLRQEMIMLLFDKQDFIEPEVFKDLLSITLKLINKRLKKNSHEKYFDIIRYEMLLTVLSDDLFKIVYDNVEGKHKESKKFLLKETEKIVNIKKYYDELIDEIDPTSEKVYKIDKYLINLPFKYIYKFILDNKDKFIENNDNTEDNKLLQYLGKIVSPKILIDFYNKNKNFIKSCSSKNKLLIKIKVLSYIKSKKKRLSKFQNIEFDFQRMLISMLYINKHLRNIILQQKKLTKELFYEIDKNKQILNNLNKIQFNKCKDLIYIHDKCIPQSQDNSKLFFEQFKDEPLLVIEVEKKEPFVFQDKIELTKQKNQTITYFMVGAYIGNRDLNSIGEFFVYNHYNSTFFQVGKNYNNIQMDLEKYISQLSKEKKLDKSIYFLFTPVSKEREKYKLISKSDYE